METQVIIPSPRDEYVELARTRETRGTRFRKHLLNLGPLIHPTTGERLQLDEAWYGQLEKNFHDGVCDIVQVPLADAQNKHTEDPLRNAGEVVGLHRDGSKIYVDLDIRDPKAADGLRNGTLLGASAFLNLNYTDTRTGRKVGPTLLHSCITNRPYVTGLDDYEEVVAATADGEGDVVVLSQEGEDKMTREEMLAALKEEHGIDVEALQSAASQKADVSQLTAALTTALQGTGTDVKLSGTEGEVSLTDLSGAIVELAQLSQRQDSEITKLKREGAEREVQGYIDTGRALPKQKAHLVKLAMEDRDSLEIMLSDEPLVELNAPRGTTGTPQGEHKQTTDIDGEIVRLSAIAASQTESRRPTARVAVGK